MSMTSVILKEARANLFIRFGAEAERPYCSFNNVASFSIDVLFSFKKPFIRVLVCSIRSLGAFYFADVVLLVHSRAECMTHFQL